MSNTDTNKTAGKPAIESATADVRDQELRTNTRLRQKYYMDEKDIISGIHTKSQGNRQKYSKVITASAAKFKTKPVMIRCTLATPPEKIKVEVVRDGSTITGIRINCPCGRHTELNFAYKKDESVK